MSKSKVKKLKLGELFCGPGGLSLGASFAKSINANGEILTFSHEWASDIDESSCETYRENIKPNLVLNDDVKNIDIDSLKKIDVFAYGFPCNDFSLVGEQKGFDGKFGALYKYGVEIINKFDPVAFVAENVGGINSSNGGLAFKKILSDLADSGKGYNLTVHLYKSEDYGVPQTRHRYIIIGIRRDLKKIFKVPKPTHAKKHVTAQEALSNIPCDASNNEHTKISETVKERLKYIKPGENVWNASLPKHLELNVKGAKLSQIYKRLSPNRPSYTITGSGGGGTHGYHYNECRPLTNRERARIQTFPDDFVFHGSKEQVRKQIGMAVPPLLSKVIFNALLDTLNGVEYDYIEANYVFNRVLELDFDGMPKSLKSKKLVLM
jgi:DNA (cytosine-5)-methyltransferase 1